MALPGFRNHPKFRRLVAALRMPEAHVLGHVEMMWEVCYESGNAVLGDSVDVELAAGWVGEPGALCRALAECGGKTRSGLIEEIEPDVWQVHDLLDHAPEYVDSRRKRMEERGKDKTCSHCGGIFRAADVRAKFCSDACRKDDWQRRHRDAQTTDDDGSTTDDDGSTTDRRRMTTDDDAQTTDDDGTTSPAQPSKDNYNPLPPLGPGDPPASAGDEGGGKPPGKAKKKTKPRGRDFGIEALKLPVDVEQAYERTWKGYPQKGWDFRTRREQARRLNYAEGASRFYDILRFTDVRHDDGTLITAEELADATLGYIAERQVEAKRQGLPVPCVPCIANFFSSVEGQKNHWKEALLRFFDAVPSEVPA